MIWIMLAWSLARCYSLSCLTCGPLRTPSAAHYSDRIERRSSSRYRELPPPPFPVRTCQTPCSTCNRNACEYRICIGQSNKSSRVWVFHVLLRSTTSKRKATQWCELLRGQRKRATFDKTYLWSEFDEAHVAAHRALRARLRGETISKITYV
jgi:hypothetical protein